MLSRSTLVARSLPVAVARRSFATSSFVRADERTPQAGHTSQSGSFKKREKAAEDQYILERERERYQQAKKQLEKQKKDLDELEAKHKK